MRTPLPWMTVLPLVVVIGCGMNQPPPTVYVTVPQAVAKPKDAIRPKPTETAKPSHPWEEAQSHFKRVKETEKEKTEAKLKKLDKLTESLYRHWMKVEIDLTKAGTGTETRAFGVILWEEGFTEYITVRSETNLHNERFLAAFRKLNPSPTSDEIVNAVLRFTVTRKDVRDLTLEMLEEGRDTRNLPQAHKAAAAWSGK